MAGTARSGLAARVVLGLLFYGLGGWFVWMLLQAHDIAGQVTRLMSAPGGAVVALWVVARVLTAGIWSVLVVGNSGARRLVLAGAAFALGAPGKYVPGKVLSLVARVMAGRMLGISLTRIVSASAVEFVVAVAMTTTLGAAIALTLDANCLAAAIIVAMVPAVACLPQVVRLAPPAVARWLHHHGLTELIHPGRLLVSSLVSLLAALCVAAGCAIWFGSLDAGLTGRQVATMTAGYLLSLAFSVVMVIAPAGVGAREFGLYAWLHGVIDEPVIATVLLTTRLLDLAADLVFTALGAMAFVWARRAGSATRAVA